MKKGKTNNLAFAFGESKEQPKKTTVKKAVVKKEISEFKMSSQLKTLFEKNNDVLKLESFLKKNISASKLAISKSESNLRTAKKDFEKYDALLNELKQIKLKL